MEKFENPLQVLVVGAGAGGICAAIQAARLGARVLLVEKDKEIGGTGVHSPVGLVCKFQRRDTYEPINRGLHKELFTHAYQWSGEFSESDRLPTYDHNELRAKYGELTAAEKNLKIVTGVSVESVETQPPLHDVASSGRRRIRAVKLSTGERIEALAIVDGTADGNLAAMAGASYHKGRESDGKMQSATLTFGIKRFDTSLFKNLEINTWGGYWSLNDELSDLYKKAKMAKETKNPKSQIYAFAYPDGKTLLFNCNEVGGVDPTNPKSVEAGRAVAETYVKDLIRILKKHPGFARSEVAFISTKFGVREGRRILGDYILTGKDCIDEARFDDMVAAGAYDIDIHDPDECVDRMQRIPNTQFYHIPYRCLISRDHTNLLLGSRCISGDFEAHSSYRVMSCVTAIGQAAGTAAALAAFTSDGEVRGVNASWIRYCLDKADQFTQGDLRRPPIP